MTSCKIHAMSFTCKINLRLFIIINTYFFVVSNFFFCSIQFQCSSSFKTRNGQNIWLIPCAACFYKNTQSSNSNHFQGCSPLFPDICHPLKCFFVLLPLWDFAQIYDTLVGTIRAVTMSTQWCKWIGVWSLVPMVVSYFNTADWNHSP